ncbi:hypothetical protein [Rhizobium tumorigenes]|uniref:Uncharacterized protein n=1 Tax=Rhizobium tumorigenes TaxID=2041385 RepID=A0AAF1KD14_9HYPH|nr:hypothetical protein [Rhizobium tumorigenes]WFR94113.1 hypothetical protein PR017_09640 [Rhizobium tumorigenes]
MSRISELEDGAAICSILRQSVEQRIVTAGIKADVLAKIAPCQDALVSSVLTPVYRRVQLHPAILNAWLYSHPSVVEFTGIVNDPVA